MYKLLVWIFLFTLTSLACGLQTEPFRTGSESVYARTEITREVSTEVKYTVTADTLNVRECAGTDCPVIVGLELHKGDIVTCLEFDGSWCRHWQGWSHTGWMK